MEIINWLMIIAFFSLFAWRPKIGLYATALCLPIIGWDIYLGNLIIPFIDLLALLTLLAFISRKVFDSLVMNKKEASLKWPLIIPFSLFFLASLISNIFSIHASESLYYFLRWPFFLYFAYIFAPANLIQDARTLKKVVVLIFIGTVMVLISGYVSLFEQDFSNAFFRLQSASFLGIYPFGENHNLIAEFLNIGAFFILIIKEFLEKPRYRRLANLLFFISVLGILISFSRAAWITLALQSTLYLLIKLRSEPSKKRVAVMIIGLTIIILSPLAWRMDLLQDSNTGSTSSRVLLSEIAYKSWLEKPLFGHGSGEFINLVGADIRYRANHGEPMDSHGLIQKVLAENGLIGLIAWLGILFYLARFGFLAVKKYYPKVKWVLPFALAAGGGLFFQLFNTSYYKGRVWLPLIIFVIAIEMSEKRSKIYETKNKNTPNNS